MAVPNVIKRKRLSIPFVVIVLRLMCQINGRLDSILDKLKLRIQTTFTNLMIAIAQYFTPLTSLIE